MPRVDLSDSEALINLVLLGAGNSNGARQCVGDEQIEAHTFFFCSFHQGLVERFRQADGEFAAKFHVLVFGATTLGGMPQRRFANSGFPRSSWLLVSCFSWSGRPGCALGFW